MVIVLPVQSELDQSLSVVQLWLEQSANKLVSSVCFLSGTMFSSMIDHAHCRRSLQMMIVSAYDVKYS